MKSSYNPTLGMCFKSIRNKFLAICLDMFLNRCMNILERVETIRNELKAFGSPVVIAEQSGVTYAWLSKFLRGSITNPTVDNIGKLEAFLQNNKDAA
jgi:hypothetical protein